jgi:hypothetical protein
MEVVIEFIDLWKKLEQAELIFTYENNISPYLQNYVFMIPLSRQDKRPVGKFNNAAFHLTKNF